MKQKLFNAIRSLPMLDKDKQDFIKVIEEHAGKCQGNIDNLDYNYYKFSVDTEDMFMTYISILHAITNDLDVICHGILLENNTWLLGYMPYALNYYVKFPKYEEKIVRIQGEEGRWDKTVAIVKSGDIVNKIASIVEDEDKFLNEVLPLINETFLPITKEEFYSMIENIE